MRVLWSQFILKTLKKHVWNCLTIQNNWRLSIHKLSRLSRKLSGPSEKYQYYSETFQAIQKLNRPSGKYPDYPETFQAIRKLSRLSGNFPDHPENIQPIRKLSKGSGNFPVQFQGLRAKTFRTRKNFPGGNATLPPRFLRLWAVCWNLDVFRYLGKMFWKICESIDLKGVWLSCYSFF